jgi:hypothetical protein
VPLEGSTMRSDDSANNNLNGKELSAKEIGREGKGPYARLGQATGRASAEDVA